MNKGFTPAFYISLALFAVMLLLSSCKKEEELEKGLSKSEIISDLKTSTWHITSFENGNDDLYPQCSDYLFHFYADSSLVISHQSESISGSWDIEESENDKLIINLVVNNPSTTACTELSDAWSIVTYVSSHLQLSSGKSNIKGLTLNRD